MENKEELLEEYGSLMERMLRSGIVRSGNVISDYGEHMAAKRLGLELMVDRGPFDAVDAEGRKYEIKTRTSGSYMNNGGPQLDLNQLKSCDYLVYVEFGLQWGLTKLLKIPAEEVKYKKKGKRLIIDDETLRRYDVLNEIKKGF